jgi:type II secretory pathway pseudopilin PulG
MRARMKNKPSGREGAELGFSLVEILLVIAITTIGFMALVNLQIGTIKAIAGSKGVLEATNLAEHLLESMKTEALQWTGVQGQLGAADKFPFLYRAASGAAVATGQTGWLKAFTQKGADGRVGAVGEAGLWDAGIHGEFPTGTYRKYCVHYRLAWLITDYLLRADVRVMWLREGADASKYAACDAGSNMERDFGNVLTVTVSGMVSANVFGAMP